MIRRPGRILGVLGGMGPAATLDFLAKLQRATGATSDQDHVHVLVDLNPQVPDHNAALAGTGPPGCGLALLLGVDQMLDMGRSATNVLGNFVAACVVDRYEQD